MVVIGLTGLIGAGKSTVARLLAERGAEVIDSDALAREAVAPGSAGLAAVAARFGPQVIGADGALDRAGLGRRVFAEPAELAALEAILHPIVGQLRAARLARSTAAVVVVEAIKLIEAGYADDCTAVWVVTAPTELRVDRLRRARGLDEATARQRIAAQTNLATMLQRADRVLENDGSLADLTATVDRACQELPGGWPRGPSSMPPPA